MAEHPRVHRGRAQVEDRVRPVLVQQRHAPAQCKLAVARKLARLDGGDELGIAVGLHAPRHRVHRNSDGVPCVVQDVPLIAKAAERAQAAGISHERERALHLFVFFGL
ncbi:MAG: hypothetical protein ACK55Z_28400 [bacterium]